MRNFIPENTVYGFDHAAVDDTVIACNMAHTPMKDESLDVAVFSLSISWGNTFHEEYVKEAYRLLSFDGLIYIAEPSKAYNDEEKQNLIKMLEKMVLVSLCIMMAEHMRTEVSFFILLQLNVKKCKKCVFLLIINYVYIHKALIYTKLK